NPNAELPDGVMEAASHAVAEQQAGDRGSNRHAEQAPTNGGNNPVVELVRLLDLPQVELPQFHTGGDDLPLQEVGQGRVVGGEIGRGNFGTPAPIVEILFKAVVDLPNQSAFRFQVGQDFRFFEQLVSVGVHPLHVRVKPRGFGVAGAVA